MGKAVSGLPPFGMNFFLFRYFTIHAAELTYRAYYTFLSLLKSISGLSDFLFLIFLPFRIITSRQSSVADWDYSSLFRVGIHFFVRI